MMAVLQTFDGWRYHPEKLAIAKVLVPAFFGGHREAIRSFYHREPRNVIRLLASSGEEISSGLSSSGSRAVTHLDAWIAEDLLYHDRPALYLLEQEFLLGDTVVKRRGLLVRVLLGSDTVRFLSDDPGPSVEAELRRMRALRGQIEACPALLSVGERAFSLLLETLVSWNPTVEVTLEDKVTTRYWVVDRVESTGPVLAAASALQLLLLAGRSRFEAALLYRDEVRSAMSAAGIPLPPLGALASDSLLVALFPADGAGVLVPGTHSARSLDPHFPLGEPGPLLSSLRDEDLAPARLFPAVPTGLVFHLFRR